METPEYGSIDVKYIDQNSAWASSHVLHFWHPMTIREMIFCDWENADAENIEKDMKTIIYGYAADNQRSIADRFVRIEEKDGTKYEMPFPSKEVTDSKALHYLLSYIDPGDEYTVVFGKKN